MPTQLVVTLNRIPTVPLEFIMTNCLPALLFFSFFVRTIMLLPLMLCFAANYFNYIDDKHCSSTPVLLNWHDDLNLNVKEKKVQWYNIN